MILMGKFSWQRNVTILKAMRAFEVSKQGSGKRNSLKYRPTTSSSESVVTTMVLSSCMSKEMMSSCCFFHKRALNMQRTEGILVTGIRHCFRFVFLPQVIH
jgi:hypothetical protein